MRKVVSIHHYRLKPGVTDENFVDAVQEAKNRKLFDLPGLEDYYFLRGIKGESTGQWSAVWIYTSRSDWEHLWGSPAEPKTRDLYPNVWRIWEDELLSPLLSEHPDSIRFSAYDEVLAASNGS